MTRIALLTLDSPVSVPAVAALLADPPGEVVLCLHSARAALLRRGWCHLRRSGPRLLPYLLAGYVVPGALGAGLAGVARAHGVALRRVGDVNGPAAAALLRAAHPDLLLTLHFDGILSPTTLALAPWGGINLHPSLLPRHRGPMPTIHALAEPDPCFGVSVHRLTPRIDAGPILAQVAVALPPAVTALGAARALHLAGVPLLRDAVAGLAFGAGPAATPDALPYCAAPSAALLAALANRGRRLADGADLRAALIGAPA